MASRSRLTSTLSAATYADLRDRRQAIGTDFVCYRRAGELDADFTSRANSEARAADPRRLQILIFGTGPEREAQ
jgi:hypothetical protein